MKWRVIITDTESPSGVAPVCVNTYKHHWGDSADPQIFDDCCIGPHIECWFPANARLIADHLTEIDAEICS